MKSLPLLLKQFCAVMSMAGLFLVSFPAVAKEKKWQKTLTGSEIQIDAVAMAKDLEIGGSYSIDYEESATYVELKIDDYLGPFHWYVYTIALEITPVLNNGAMGTSYKTTLVVENYRFGGTANYVDLVKHKVPNSRGASVKILSLYHQERPSNVTTSVTPANVSLTVSYESRRYYSFDEQTVVNFLDPDISNPDELTMKWEEILEAEEYELAWTWVDNYSNGYGESFTDLTEDEVFLSVRQFEQNCTRIQTTGLQYKIPMVYDNGYLVFRIRAIGRSSDDNSKRIFGVWNITPAEAFGGPPFNLPIPMMVSWWNIGTNVLQTSSGPIGKAKNWQFQASYAEGGKKKDVVSYFDGSLRNRQTVTKINTSGTAIVGEVIYDEEGRPAIEVLPVPSSTASLRYVPNFNLNMAGKAYSFKDFLASSNVCDVTTGGMLNTVGASKYYSQQPGNQTYQDFVPVAVNFPFSQIEYTLDNTGRVKRKGGVGPTHQLGTNHEMKYFYSVPAQHELNRLFGYNVGWASHYKKNVVIDPNKQVSVSYLDPQGRTVATALGASATLAGIAPLDESSAALHPSFKTDLLNKLTAAAVDTPLDNNNRISTGRFGNLQDGLKYSSQKVFTENDIYTFNYTMKNTNVFTRQCNTLNYTYPFIYVLNRRVMDECGNGITGASIDTTTQVGTYTETSTGYASTDNSFLSNTSFPLTLAAGAYEVSKELTVDEAALNFFADDYIARGRSQGCILEPQAPNAIIDGCFKTCQSCTDYYTTGIKFTPEGGTQLTGQAAYVAMMKATNYDYRQLPVPVSVADNTLFEARFNREYVLLLAACKEPCKKDGYAIGDANATMSSMMCDNSLDVLLADMMPNGQYGIYGSDLDEQGNVVEGNEDMAINQLPLTVYNDNMVEATGMVTNKVFARVNGIDATNANWRNPHYYNALGLVSSQNNDGFKHYFTPSGDPDYVSLQWDTDTQQFTPPVLAAYNTPALLLTLGSNLAVEADAGRYKVEPQYLANVEDFIAAIASRPSWAMSLVKYHPEFHYLDYVYKMCSIKETASYEIDPATSGTESITYNSDGLDALLGSCKTYSEAVTAGFLTTSLSIFNNDPFFKYVHPLDATIVAGLTVPNDGASAATFLEMKQSIMKNALDRFTGTGGDPNSPNNPGKYENTGLIIAHYIYKTIKCGGLSGSCPAPTLSANVTFAEIMGVVNNNLYFNDAERDLFWHYYVSYYVGLKQKIRSVFLNAHALRQGFYNDCIGNDNSENVNVITAIISKYGAQRGQIAGWLVPQAQTLHSKNGQYLKDKEKRFQPFDELYDSEKSEEGIYQDMKDDAGSYYLSSTGNCPRILDLTIFLENFLKKDPVVAGAIAPFNGNYLTPDLFKALGGFYSQTPGGPSPNDEPDADDVKVSSGVITDLGVQKLRILFSQQVPNMPMTPIDLQILSNPNSIVWNGGSSANNRINNSPSATSGWRIIQISQLTHVLPIEADGKYKFRCLATLKANNSSGEVVEVIIEGKTKVVLACSTDAGIAASQGSVYVNPQTSPPCTKKEDFTKALKDLIVNLQGPNGNGLISPLNGSVEFILNGNEVFNDGYLREYFGMENVSYNIKWHSTLNYTSTINNVTTVLPGNFHGLEIDLPEPNGAAIKMFMQLDLTNPIFSLEIGGVAPSSTPGISGIGNIVKAKDIYGNEVTGMIYGTNLFSELEFACCKQRDSLPIQQPVDLNYSDYLIAVKNVFNEVLEYVSDNIEEITEEAALTPLLDGYGMPYETTSENFLNIMRFYTFPASVSIILNGIEGYPVPGGFANYRLIIKTTGNSENYLTLYFNSLNDRIYAIQNTGQVQPNDSVNELHLLDLASGTPVFFTNGTQGEISLYIKSAASVYKLPTCPCIPQPVEPVICKQKYDLYAAHLLAFGLTNNLAQVNTIEPSVNFTAQQVFCGLNYQTIWDGYSYYLSKFQITSTEHLKYISLPAFGGTALNYGYSDYNSVIDEFADYLVSGPRVFLGSNSVYYVEESTIPAYINNYVEVDTWVEYAAYYVRKEQICPPAPMVPKIPIRFIRNNDCLDYSKAVNETYNAEAYETYINSLKDAFKRDYLDQALTKAVETFDLTYSEKEYQYTLYYYDQAGNMVQTVAPEGVSKFNLYTNPNLNNTINSYRKTNSTIDNTTLLPAHKFKTQYRYNSLNQLVWQSTPDGGETRFAYDKLGRIVASQNSNQLYALINNPKFTLSKGLSELGNGNFVKDATGTAWLGAHTGAILPAEGYVQYTIDKDSGNDFINDGVIVGLSYANVTGDPSSVRYAFRVASLTSVYTRQNTSDSNTGLTLNHRDVLRIERKDGKILWYRNSTVILAVSEANPGAPMLVDLGINTYRSEIRELKIVRYDLKDKFSYTRYDALGRIDEAGQMDAESLLAINDNGRLVYQSNMANEVNVDAVMVNFPHNVSKNQIEVTKTLYDTYSTSFNPDHYLSVGPRNTRNRVTAILTYDSANASTPLTKFETAIFYNYDIHGNVNEMVQVLSSTVIDVNGANIKKRVNYEYDLISGNVNKVIYQKDGPDQFIHRYHYDADNRITNVQTSKDNAIWETDATYKYYEHGPLARVELGDKKVQGVDYAYTLQGWLKTVNSETLSNANKDMGRDGNVVSKDAYGYSLSYFDNDYTPRAAGSNQAHSLSPSNASFQGNDLFNGNIKRMITSLRENTEENILPTQVNLYNYDQLNRIFSMHSFKGTEGIGIAFGDSYASSYTYDKNGNLKTLMRTAPRVGYATPQPMDNFTYNYQAATNKLTHILDTVPATHFGTAVENIDIDNQEANNYTYDGIGQLVTDKAEKIKKIFWRADGKVKSIEKDNGQFVNFYYDGLGNRVAKSLVLGASKTASHYARDAQGNVLGVYDFIKQATPLYDLREHHIYGSSRLGLQAYENNYPALNFERQVGDKRYELSNHLGNVLSVIDDRKIIESDTQFLASDTFDTTKGTWISDGSGPSVNFHSATKSLSVTTVSSNNTGAKRNLSLQAGSQVVLNMKVTKPAPSTPLEIKVKQGSTTLFRFPIDNNGNTVGVFTVPTTGTYTVGVGLTQTVSPAITFYIDNFYAYSIPMYPEDHISLFVPNVLSYNDYYPFGMIVPEPKRNVATDYRYGFQGQEKDDEIKGGEGNSLNYTFRMHDPRAGRFFAVDPLTKKYPHYTPYSFSGNKVIAFTELEGMEERWVISDNSVIYEPGPRLGGYDSEALAYDAYFAMQKKQNQFPSLKQDNRGDEQIKRERKDREWAKIDADRQNMYYSSPTSMIAHGFAVGVPELGMDLLTEGAFSYAKTSYVFRVIAKSKIATKATAGLEKIGIATDLTSSLSKVINPSGSKANCVYCAIEFQKSIMGKIYGAAKNTSGYGLTDEQVFSALYAEFSSVKPFTSGGKVHDLSNKLSSTLVNNKDSAIIVGTLKDQSKFKAHAFNAVKNSEGNWDYIDLQNGVKYNEKAMEQTFTNYKIYDVK